MSRWLEAVGLTAADKRTTDETRNNVRVDRFLRVIPVSQLTEERRAGAPDRAYKDGSLCRKSPGEPIAFGVLKRCADRSRPEMGDDAARAWGFPDAVGYRAQLLSYWRGGLESLLAAGVDATGRHCIAAALGFIAKGWAEKAIRMGWTEQDLVWADTVSPWARLDSLGAAYFTGSISKIDEACIVYDTGDGCTLVLPRRRKHEHRSIPWGGLDG